MDITKFVVQSRQQALLDGNYATYRAQLGRRLLKSRKKLGIATKHRGKYNAKAPITQEQLAEKPEYLHLQLLTAERAWAHAMAMRAAHEADTQGLSGHTRSHIVSRLEKAAKAAEHLAAVLGAGAGAGAGATDGLEARAYAALVRGGAHFEKRAWAACLRSYAVARAVYGGLSAGAAAARGGGVFRDLLAETIDPSMRYAAYQLKTPRSVPISAIARRAFPHDDEELVASVRELDPGILKEGEKTQSRDDADVEGAPKTITWRSRQVRIEDAAIATAWGALGKAKSTLAEKLASTRQMAPKDMAAAYDDVLTVSQDAADATKEAIDELRAEGVPQSDARMQSLYVTRTAVNYEMISWRIGRNRVLMGGHDGALFEAEAPLRKRKAAKEDDEVRKSAKPEAPGRQIARLKEKVVLYDGTLKSLESIAELPGVAADGELSAQMDATFQYFNALKCLAIARSHALTENLANALALVKYGHDQCQTCLPVLSKPSEGADTAVRNIQISPADAEFLHELLSGELQRYRALVDLEKLEKPTAAGAAKGKAKALAERLGEYPSDPVDLHNIVTYPPRLEVMAAKPIFLDVAWNYIEYPDKKSKTEGKGKERAAGKEAPGEGKPAQKRGWFGFGR